MTVKAGAIVFGLLLIGVVLVAEEQHHHEMTAQQLGSVSFSISCSADAQKLFEQGVAWLHSFEYEQAGNEFQRAAESDPQCAMAKWGQAMSLYHQLWARPSKEDVHRGAELLQQARALKPKTQREREYIDALAIFYSGDDAEQYKKRVKDYSEAMDKLRQDNPNDREAAVFYALSLLSQVDDKDPDLTMARKAIAILNEQLPGAPNHPGITHYIIHATDNPKLASMGLDAARAYARIAASSVHAVHMPSHIFARLGLWQDDIQSNLAALKVADQMTGLHMGHHRIHSMDFLEYAYLQIGDDRNAKAQIDELRQMSADSIDPQYSDYYQEAMIQSAAMYFLERKQWKDAMALVADPASPPYVQAVAYWARAIAAGHLRDAAAARSAADQLVAMIEATKKSAKPYYAESMDTNRDESIAWASHAEGNDDQAVQLLRKVADEQDQVGKGETELPAREMLADLLFDMGHYEDALHEYESSLHTDPNRFNGLYGAARTAELVKQQQKADQYYAQLLKNCSGTNSDRPELANAKAMVAAQ